MAYGSKDVMAYGSKDTCSIYGSKHVKDIIACNGFYCI